MTVIKINNLKIKASITDNQPVVILPVLFCEDEEFTIISYKPKSAFEFAELPTGITSGGLFTGAVAKELKEKAGLEFCLDELMPLNAEPIFFSASGNNDAVIFYTVFCELSKEEIEDLRKKCTGELKGDKQIILKIIPFHELTATAKQDAKSLIADTLYLRSGYSEIIIKRHLFNKIIKRGYCRDCSGLGCYGNGDVCSNHYCSKEYHLKSGYPTIKDGQCFNYELGEWVNWEVFVDDTSSVYRGFFSN